jgi:rare lipoprotein A
MRNFLRLISCAIFFLGITLLNGCSTTTSNKVIQDGPPPYEVDVSTIPDAVPKAEKASKYGNMPSYKVYGKSYYPLKTSKNYHEVGHASWYGRKFHAQRTSSGEPYDMLLMTAAHKTLPLPSYVQVTNLANNRKVIVKVNDRGPFASNRILDLSYVAAKKLGIVGHGTAKVDIRAITPGDDSYKNAPVFAKNRSSKFVYLQVGAYQNRARAENMKSRLKSWTSSSVKITQHVKSSKHLYRVQIGPIKDVATAKKITKRLKAVGITVA